MRKNSTLALRMVNIDNDGIHLHVAININGRKANLVLDTGASRTVFDKRKIKKFVKNSRAKLHDKLSSGLGTNDMRSHKITIKKIKLGEIELKNYESVLLDLSHVNKSYKQIGLKPIDGILGGDILNLHNAMISYAPAQLQLFY